MAQERSKAGLAESASVQRIEVTSDLLSRSANWDAAPLDPGWYLYDRQAVYVYPHDNVLMARGYDFNTKSEWRTPVGNLNAALFVRLVEAGQPR